ncbi:uncharacterized protein EHS24_002135 [Apiotrichum porosum]|uniref:Uncharacterized protein n=1 Tax=Apiotrichum porosum TaxID=105984 RepID=A0A427XHN9_9TREE|nr:uncharacterized protein EHS24_002135 [Apiotrichum porosum]RSH78410.1 hypothetical protein EHS24_002135 [Apiotrichum porosum]
MSLPKCDPQCFSSPPAFRSSHTQPPGAVLYHGEGVSQARAAGTVSTNYVGEWLGLRTWASIPRSSASCPPSPRGATIGIVHEHSTKARQRRVPRIQAKPGGGGAPTTRRRWATPARRIKDEGLDKHPMLGRHILAMSHPGELRKVSTGQQLDAAKGVDEDASCGLWWSAEHSARSNSEARRVRALACVPGSPAGERLPVCRY